LIECSTGKRRNHDVETFLHSNLDVNGYPRLRTVEAKESGIRLVLSPAVGQCLFADMLSKLRVTEPMPLSALFPSIYHSRDKGLCGELFSST
jgi:hypothetical protein